MDISICSICDGTGEIRYSEGHHAGSTTIKNEKCSSCGGTGRVTHWNFGYPVKIPFGMYQKEAAKFQSEMFEKIREFEKGMKYATRIWVDKN